MNSHLNQPHVTDGKPDVSREKAIVNKNPDTSKRFNLVLPKAVYDEVDKVAKQQNTTVVDLLRRFVKLGLVLTKLEGSPDATLLIREGDTERQIVWI